MGQGTEDMNKTGAGTSPPFPKMLPMDDVQEILNLGKPMVYALVRSGELKAAKFGPRGYLAQSWGSMRFLHGTHGQGA